MEKKMILACIIRVCEQQNWEYQLNIKTDRWKADITISYGTYTVAFNVCKRPTQMESKYSIMRQDRTCGCWLIMPSTLDRFSKDSDLPCFSLTEEYDVKINSSTVISLPDFIRAIVVGNVRRAQELRVQAADVYVFQEQCYKCGSPNYVYFIKRLVTDNGAVLLYLKDFADNLTFNPYVIRGVQKAMSQQGNTNVHLSIIKERYSHTRNETYISFGCHRCDSLFGDWFIQDSILDLIYDDDESKIIHIDIKDANIVIPMTYWCLVK